MENKEMTVRDAIVMPAVSPEDAVKAFEAYQSLAKKIMTADDVQKIGDKDFKRKSFWRKCQRFFNLSVEIVKEEREVYDGYFAYKFVVRATAPNGAYMDGTGTCSSNEKGMEKTEHNTRAIAETRAKNRAISDLVAFGEVSAEEVTAGNGHSEEVHAEPIKKSSGTKITEAQGKLIYARWKAAKLDDNEVKAYLKDTFGIDHTKDLEKENLDAVLEWIGK